MRISIGKGLGIAAPAQAVLLLMGAGTHAQAEVYTYELTGELTGLTGTPDLIPELAGVGLGSQWVLSVTVDSDNPFIPGLYRVDEEDITVAFDGGAALGVDSATIQFITGFSSHQIVIAGILGNLLSGNYTSIGMTLTDPTSTALGGGGAVGGLELADFSSASNPNSFSMSNNSLSYTFNGPITGLTTSGGESLPGDTDGDGDIDDADLGTTISNFTGPVGAAGGKTLADGDTNADGDVDDADVGTAIAGFTGPMSPTPVPEPGGLALLSAAGVLIFRRRRG